MYEAVESHYAEKCFCASQAEYAMARRPKKKNSVRKVKSARMPDVFLLAMKDASELPDSEYDRSFLQQKLIRGWIAIIASIAALGLLVISLLDRLF